jgi:hypothetical protein
MRMSGSIDQLKLDDIMRLSFEMQHVREMPFVTLRRTEKEFMIPWISKGPVDKAECVCPECGVDALHYITNDQRGQYWFHTCALCLKRYIIYCPVKWRIGEIHGHLEEPKTSTCPDCCREAGQSAAATPSEGLAEGRIGCVQVREE